MAEMESEDVAEPVSPEEATKSGPRPADRQGLLQHSREFLDFFWDIAKPQQEARLEATEKLLEYLRTRPEGSEMKYALKRLITGLGVGRETSRPCYSLALAQLLQSFEAIPLCSVLQQIQETHDLQKVKKTMIRSALFANLFGVLALFQSGRLVKDQEMLMKSVELLQVLAQHHNHLQEQPQKALVDLLSETPEASLKEILPKVLPANLNMVLGSPEHLELFLLAKQKVPETLEKLLGPVNLFSDENLPRLVDVLKVASIAVKKERRLPAVALNLLRLALQEEQFPRFWEDVVEQGLLKKEYWPSSYLCFRLLGAALPLLSKVQLQLVMRGDLIRLIGEHLISAKHPDRFKFAPEMDEYVGTFLKGCQDDPERQLALVVAFSSLTNQGHPVVPTFWRVVRFLSPRALGDYVAWLQAMFLQPDLDSLVDFSTSNQKRSQHFSLHGPERAVFRLRKWIILRLVSIVEDAQVEKEEALIEETARFCLFHSFFDTKKPMSQIPETGQPFSFPLQSRTREIVSTAFFSLLQALGSPTKQGPGQTQDGRPWTYHLVQFADTLLSHSRNVATVTAFKAQQRQAWNRMLQTVKELETRSSEAKAFQHLLLLVGIHLFKSPAESCDLLGDIQVCIQKSLEGKTRRTRSKAADLQEPPWAEVLVEVLLALLAQPNHLMRQVARSVFSHICPHLTPRALQLILDVLNPEKSQEEDDNVVVVDDSEEEEKEELEDAEDKKSQDGSDREDSEESEEEESEEEDRDMDVDEGFREQLMAVLQAGKAPGEVDNEEEEEEELGDEAMMALDQELSSIFAKQKLRIQARRDEKNKLQKEKVLRRDFQIRVLDLIEVLVTKQPEHPLVLELIEPLLLIIRRSMRASSTKQEQDLLRKTARIFMHNLCHSRHYCRNLGDSVGTLHTQVERLVQQAGHQADSSIALYYFNAAFYLLRVLKGNTADSETLKAPKQQKASNGSSPESQAPEAASCLDLSLVTPAYSAALSSFLTKRNCPLTIPMFLSVFTRHPVLCKNLLPIMAQHMTGPTRARQQAQACLLLQKSLSICELRSCFEKPEWEELIGQILAKVTENLQTLGKAQAKSEQQKELSSVELLITLLRAVKQQDLTVDLTTILGVLQGVQPSLRQSLQQGEHVAGSSRLYDLYWQALKFLGVQRPKSEKKSVREVPSAPQNPISMKRKKRGFLPETKRRRKHKPEKTPEDEARQPSTGGEQPPSSGRRRRRRRMRARVSAQFQVNGRPSANPSTPAIPTTSPSTPAKSPKLRKKRQKQSQVNGATPVASSEPASKKLRQKALHKKGRSGKSPWSTPPQKRSRLSFSNGIPSFLRSGAKKKKVQPKTGQEPCTQTLPLSPHLQQP
ncbi:LOW QUALITY PROTEIN: myb-binding protein 1A [Dasypus novemcinctus]|uniref:LOW QUALITY PROTEIN: myb-binding protein 1A n=1 Tax=Dasypus novemcinctus TaxID=9361 RepID=UPI00265E4B3C|nr:LOW QUALITY PROTEIN: myb-binding protein 1A [Dasypus novemcinctus]